MQNILIVLIVIAFFGGVLSKCNSIHTTGGSILSAFGFKSKEQIQREELEKLVNKYLKDQSKYLGDSEEVMSPLSKYIQDSYNDKSPNLMPLQSLMKSFTDQNTILVKNGKELSSYSDDQKKANKRIAAEMEVSTILSKSDQLELFNKQKDILDKQRQLIDQLQNKIKEIKNDPHANINSQLLDQADHASSRIAENLDGLRQQQEAIKNIATPSASKTNVMREQIEESKRKNADSLRDTHDRIEDQTRQMNDRIRDQMEKLKDRR